MANSAGEVRIKLQADTKQVKEAFKQLLTQMRLVRKQAALLQKSLNFKVNQNSLKIASQIRQATQESQKLASSFGGFKSAVTASGIPLDRIFAKTRQVNIELKKVGTTAKALKGSLTPTSAEVTGLRGRVKALVTTLQGVISKLRQVKSQKAFDQVSTSAQRSSANINKANRSVTLLVAKFALLVFAAQTLARILDSTFGNALRIVDNFRLETIEAAVGLTRIADLSKVAGSTFRSAFEQNLRFVQGIFVDLELAAIDFFATGSELQEGFNILAQQGIVIRREDIKLLGQTVDTIKLATRTITGPGQIGQEIRQLLAGQVNRTTQLGLVLQRAGADAQQLAKDIREAGSLEPLRPFVEVIGVAAKEIRQTLTSALSTTKTLLTQITRFALENTFDGVVADVQDFNKFLTDSKETIAAIATLIVSKLTKGIKGFLAEFGLVGKSGEELATAIIPLLIIGFDAIKRTLIIVVKLIGLAAAGLALILQRVNDITSIDIAGKTKTAATTLLSGGLTGAVFQAVKFFNAEEAEVEGKKVRSVIEELEDNIDSLTKKALGGLKTESLFPSLDPNSPEVQKLVADFKALLKSLRETEPFPQKVISSAEVIAAQRKTLRNQLELLERESKIRKATIAEQLKDREEGLNRESTLLKTQVQQELVSSAAAAAQRAVIEDRLIAIRLEANRQLKVEDALINKQRLNTLEAELKLEDKLGKKQDIQQDIDKQVLKEKLSANKLTAQESSIVNELTGSFDERFLSQKKFNAQLERQIKLLKDASKIQPLGTTPTEAGRNRLATSIQNAIASAERTAGQGGNVLSAKQVQARGAAETEVFEANLFQQEIRELAKNIRAAFASIVDDIVQGTVDLKETLQNLSRVLIQQGLRGLFDSLQAGLEDLFKKLAVESSKQAAQALALAIGILFAVISRTGNDASFTPGGAGGGSVVESSQAVRGIIGGDTQIAIAQINEGLQEALIPTNNILATIERNTRSLAELNLSIDPGQLAQSIQDKIGDILDQALLQVGP